VGRGDVQAELLHQPRKPWRLALRELKQEPRQRGRVDDRVLEGVLEAAPDQPCVERVVAVLHEHRAPRKAKECPSHVSELWRADQHRAIDLVAPACIWVDRRAAVDQSVEERQRAIQAEALRSNFEHKEGRVARGLDVEGHELRVFERRLRPELLRVDRDLRPRHRLGGATRLEQNRLLGHLASASALRANAISSAVTARSTRAAPA
jgi:hypothetical protein